MWTSILGILSALGSIALKVIQMWADRNQQQIGKQQAAIDAMKEGQTNVQARAQNEAEVGKLSGDQLSSRLDRWLRDKPPGD